MSGTLCLVTLFSLVNVSSKAKQFAISNGMQAKLHSLKFTLLPKDSLKSLVKITMTPSPVALLESFGTILSIAATLDWDLRQLDVKTAFLHAELDEEIYMEQPEGVVVKGHESDVCRLQRGIYGLKQPGCQWNKKLDRTMVAHHVICIAADHCIYTRTSQLGSSMIAIHTDYMCAASSTIEEMESIVCDLRSTFNMTDLGGIRWMLGIEISCNCSNKTISLCQTSYIKWFTKCFNLESTHPVYTPLNVDTKSLSLS